jgi:hypothetical protein
MQENIELPKSLFVSVSEYDFTRINAKPLYSYEKTLEEISKEEPLLATNLLENELLYGKFVASDIQVVSDQGIISTEMDGPETALGFFHKSINENIIGEIIVSPMDIVVSTFTLISKIQKKQESLISVPKFIISLEATII